LFRIVGRTSRVRAAGAKKCRSKRKRSSSSVVSSLGGIGDVQRRDEDALVAGEVLQAIDVA
jgi:hypothetical protein